MCRKHLNLLAAITIAAFLATACNNYRAVRYLRHTYLFFDPETNPPTQPQRADITWTISGNAYWFPMNMPETDLHYCFPPGPVAAFPGFSYERVVAAGGPPSLFNDTSQQPVANPKVTRTLAVPDWFLFAIATLLPLKALFATVKWRLVGRNRVRNGRCRDSGFDLRATPDRCPECGAASKGVRQ